MRPLRWCAHRASAVADRWFCPPACCPSRKAPGRSVRGWSSARSDPDPLAAHPPVRAAPAEALGEAERAAPEAALGAGRSAFAGWPARSAPEGPAAWAAPVAARVVMEVAAQVVVEAARAAAGRAAVQPHRGVERAGGREDQRAGPPGGPLE